jgi:hypothetical protein
MEQALDLGELVVGEAELAPKLLQGERLRHGAIVPADGFSDIPLS